MKGAKYWRCADDWTGRNPLAREARWRRRDEIPALSALLLGTEADADIHHLRRGRCGGVSILMIRSADGAMRGKEEVGGAIPYWNQRFGFWLGGGCVSLSLAFVFSVTRVNAAPCVDEAP
jgi:hypothetical protein